MKEKAKNYLIEKHKISVQEFDEAYELYSNVLNFLHEIVPKEKIKDKIDCDLMIDDSVYMNIFLDIIKIKKIDMAMFLDYVYMSYVAIIDSKISNSPLLAVKGFLDRLAFYSKEGADTVKYTIKYCFNYPLEYALVYNYEDLMKSQLVPDNYKKIIDLYKKIYKKYDALENGFLGFVLNESFDYFVLHESFKNDYEKVNYFLSLILEDYDKFQDIVSLSGDYFKGHRSFDELYACISIPKKTIM